MNSNSSSQKLIEIANRLCAVDISEDGNFKGARGDGTSLEKAAMIADEIADRFQGVNSSLVSVWKEISASLKGIDNEFTEKMQEYIEAILKFAKRSLVGEDQIRIVAGQASADLWDIMSGLGYKKG